MNANAHIGKHRRSITYPAHQWQLPLFQLNGPSHIFVSRKQKTENMDQIDSVMKAVPEEQVPAHSR
jgi:hypothetical protein